MGQGLERGGRAGSLQKPDGDLLSVGGEKADDGCDEEREGVRMRGGG